jgi:DNA-binding transcriptional regulator LsrR (DeoR family)
MQSDKQTDYSRRLDLSARAGWLYYVAGYKQDQIAQMLHVSRQTAQRLVSMAKTEKLIGFRLQHPIMRCMELAEQLSKEFNLKKCEVVPSVSIGAESNVGLAQAGAAAIEYELAVPDGRLVAVGTGRMLRACVEELTAMNRPDHTIVALLGETMPGGKATPYNVVVRMADRINATYYPMSLPLYAQNAKERELYRLLDMAKQIHQKAQNADVRFVGLGHIGFDAPLFVDGFMTEEEVKSYVDAGAVGEITGWLFDKNGQIIEGYANDRVNSVPLAPHPEKLVYGIASGTPRVQAIRGAMRGGLINCLITNEVTAEQILG